MFSYEDQIRAVKLYIKGGKRLRATIRRLGYPTRNSLMGWYRECEQSGDLVTPAKTRQASARVDLAAKAVA